MLTVEDYHRIRCAHRDGMSIRAIARTFSHSRQRIRDVLRDPELKSYTRTRPAPAPKLDPFKPIIEQILRDDEDAPRKQRHTSAQIFRRLKADGYVGGYDQVRRYVGTLRRRTAETFVPLHPQPGVRLECDFGHIHVDFPEGRRLVAILLLTWGYSNRVFAIALPSERVEAILFGMVAGFEYFGCVPREAWWDNPKTIATKILAGRQRVFNPRYFALANHYIFEPLCCMPRKGNEKGRVEKRVFDLQRRWATPVPQVRDLDALNTHLLTCCDAECSRTVAGKIGTIAERFDADKAAALPLPPHRFDPCIIREARSDKFQTVAFGSCRYSIPRRYAFAPVTIKGYIHEVVVLSGATEIARHTRRYEKGAQILDPMHYLATLALKPAALDCSDVFRRMMLPAPFAQARTFLESHYGPHAGARRYIRLLQLLPTRSKEDVAAAITYCLRREKLTVRAVEAALQHLVSRTVPSDSAQDDGRFALNVPHPTLDHYDRLLTLEGETDDGQETQCGPADTGESEATPPTGDSCGVCATGT